MKKNLSIGKSEEEDEASSELLESIQRQAYGYFECHTNQENGLVADSTALNSPASIAATGMGLSCSVVAVERGFCSRQQARQNALAAIRFFHNVEVDNPRNATGYRGFYYHFLDICSGERAWKSELSSIDTGLLLMGLVTAAVYFDHDSAQEREIREKVEELCERTEWNWVRNGRDAIGHGWKPERGFLVSQWTGYNEALLIYILGLGSQSHALPSSSYRAWTDEFKWKRIYDQEFFYAGPLFIHQMSQCWLDLRSVQDEVTREKGITYFENSRRATLVQREYAIRNPRNFAGYSGNSWGISASDGPGKVRRVVEDKERKFYAYLARGVPFGPDDGTLAPWAAVASLPFCPQEVMPALKHFNSLDLGSNPDYSFEATFNPTYPEDGQNGWVSPNQLGINQGPVVLMLENHRTGFLWDLLRNFPAIKRGMDRAGFRPLQPGK